MTVVWLWVGMVAMFLSGMMYGAWLSGTEWFMRQSSIYDRVRQSWENLENGGPGRDTIS
jgi:hypothetical protein